MFDRPPREKSWLSWVWVILWSAAILGFAPYVRIITNPVEQSLGRAAFTWAVIAVAVLAALSALRWLLRRGRLTPISVTVLVLVAGWIAWRSVTLRIEAVHYVQYGLLSLLFYRAFVHRVRDGAVYLMATIAGTMVGLLDETVQWLASDRVFALSDVWLNFTATALIQLALAFGIRPGLVRLRPSRWGLARTCRLAAALSVMLLLAFANTPRIIAWYGGPTDQVMVEYGHLLGRPGETVFRSRLTEEALLNETATRAEEAAKALDLYGDEESYADFLRLYTSWYDPMLHEARVHLFRRDRYLTRAPDVEDPEYKLHHWATAHLENRILEEWFGPVLAASSHRWPDGKAEDVARRAEHVWLDDSWVSRHLVTTIRPWQATLGLGLLATGLLFAARRLDRVP